MSQANNYNIANATGAAVRSDLNDVFGAVASHNSGATSPPTTYPYMLWADTSTGLLKIRNGANSAWITVGSLDTPGLNIVASKFPNVTTQVTLTSAQLNDTMTLPAGTKMVFYQAEAPSGWVKETNNADRALRVVNDSSGGGRGGTTPFSVAFTHTHTHTFQLQGHKLSVEEMPGHTHFSRNSNSDAGSGFPASGGAGQEGANHETLPTGGGLSHNHGVTGGLQSKTISPRYVNVIICTKL